MKVHIAYTIQVPDEYRRAINEYYGIEGLASREQVKDWYRNHGESMDNFLSESFDAAGDGND